MLSAKEFKAKFIDTWEQTPLEELGGVFYKREDKNPLQTVKSRGVVWQIYNLLKNKEPKAVISSSGNAGIAAAHYAKEAGIDLTIYVSEEIAEEKLERLLEYPGWVVQEENPIAEAEEFSKEFNIPLIRQSVDPVAPRGYEQLAYEVHRQLKEKGVSLKDVSMFFPVGSGTTLVGFWRGLQGVDVAGFPQIHAVQNQAAESVSREYDENYRRKARSVIRGWIRETPRKEEVMQAIGETGGSGWVVQDEQVLDAQEYLERSGIDASLGGSLALGGLGKAEEKGFALKSNKLVILT